MSITAFERSSCIASVHVRLASRMLALSWRRAISVFAPSIAALSYGALGTRFPALLPSLIGAVLGAVTVVCTLAFLTPNSPPPRARMSVAVASRPPRVCQALATQPLPLICFIRLMGGMVLFLIMDVNPLWLIASLPAGGLFLSKQQVRAHPHPPTPHHYCHSI